MNLLVDTFFDTLLSLIPLVVVAGIGALLAHFRILSSAATEGLSKVVIHIFLPALIFSRVLAGLDPAAMPWWWMVPLTAVGMFAVGLGLSLLVFNRERRVSRDVIPLGFMHNAGYFVLALGAYLVPQEFDAFSAFVFLFVLGNSPLLWSFGKAFITRGKGSAGQALRLREFITTPLLANLAALLVVLSGTADWIPLPVIQGLEMAGEGTIPAAFIVLGASLASVRIHPQTEWWVVSKCVLTKMILVPAVVLPILHFSGLRESHPLLLYMLMLQAISPHAVNLIIHIRTYGGDLERANNVILAAYLSCLITIPVWVALWAWTGSW